MKITNTHFTFFTTLLVTCLTGCNLPDIENIHVTKEGERLEIVGNSKLKELYITFKPANNNRLSTYKEIAADDPDYHEKTKGKPWDILYPIVNLKTNNRIPLSGLVIFDSIQHTSYSINGMFFPEKKAFQGDSLALEGKYLLEWENNLFLDSLSGNLQSFSLVDVVSPEADGAVYKEYQLLHPDWEGEIIVHSDNKELLRKSYLENKKDPVDKVTYPNTLNRMRLHTSLKASVGFTLRSQNHSENDPTKEGLNLFYDYDSRSFRRSTWLWGWGPSIQLLLEGAEIPELAASFPKDSLQKVALEIGEASLKFQNLDKGSPAYGVATSRWSETKNMGEFEYDFEQFYSVADGQFLAGWGWMYLYKHLGDEKFLEATRLQTEATERLIKEMANIPMDYMENLGYWKGHMISEQGFGMEGINELNRFAPNPKYQRIGKDYLDMLLAKLDHPSGGWNRAYRIKDGTAMPPLFYVRGHGWAMEGLTAGYELTKDPVYLAKAEKMARLLMDHQMPDGSWSVVLTEENIGEVSDKGTALWSLLFYRMYRFTKNESYLKTARKALEWCLDNQYFGEDTMAHGSIPNVSRASGVIYRRWFPLACNYTTGFFGLAVLEELKIQSED